MPGSRFFWRYMLRFTTAGESHGPALVSVLEGMPAGLPLLAEYVNRELARRQQGYGRGRRMQIERDSAELLSGVRAGETLGSPIAMLIRNRDWANWQEIMDPAPRDGDAAGAVARKLLSELGVTIGSHLVHLGGVDARRPEPMPSPINPAADESQL